MGSTPASQPSTSAGNKRRAEGDVEEGHSSRVEQSRMGDEEESRGAGPKSKDGPKRASQACLRVSPPLLSGASIHVSFEPRILVPAPVEIPPLSSSTLCSPDCLCSAENRSFVVSAAGRASVAPSRMPSAILGDLQSDEPGLDAWTQRWALRRTPVWRTWRAALLLFSLVWSEAPLAPATRGTAFLKACTASTLCRRGSRTSQKVSSSHKTLGRQRRPRRPSYNKVTFHPRLGRNSMIHHPPKTVRWTTPALHSLPTSHPTIHLSPGGGRTLQVLGAPSYIAGTRPARMPRTTEPSCLPFGTENQRAKDRKPRRGWQWPPRGYLSPHSRHSCTRCVWKDDWYFNR
jgi:hypothetical protein